MSVLFFAAPYCNYCSLQKDCKIKLDKEFNSKLFEALKDITLPKCMRIELNCAHFSPNKDAFKMLIKENGDIEKVTTTKLNVTCKNKVNFQPTDKSKSQGSLLYHPLQSFINKVKKLITK